MVKLIENTTIVTPGSDVAAVLDGAADEVGVHSTEIDAVIWSHNHFDHIGDMTRFPPSTELVVGPGVRGASFPGFPTRDDAIVLDADADGRKVREIVFDGRLKVGRFEAFDFFGDGSFYLLDAPGHAQGHLCALARTTAGPTDGDQSFVFMGADACHHMGVLRPCEFYPLPAGKTLQDALGQDDHSGLCPGLLESCLRNNDSAIPFFEVNAPSALFPDKDASFDTVTKIQELDALDSVFVVMAHDSSLRDKMPLFPEKINGWRTSGIKVQSRWLFCRDLLHHPK